MSYIVVEDFKLGLDRRREQVAGAPGSLWDLINAHITRGGEIEKRKAWVAKYALPAGQTFGAMAANGIRYVFGSAASPSMPAGVTYQRCRHPDGTTAMTAVLSATAFDGLPYVIARFADGAVYHFYNGARVTDWDDGVASLTMGNNQGVASHLASLLSTSTEIASAIAAGNVITVTGLSTGNTLTIEASAKNYGSVDDQAIAVATTREPVAQVLEVLATGTVTITGGTSSPGVNKVTSIKVNNVEILNASIDWAVDNQNTAQAIADQINSHVSTPDYTATVNANVVTIKALPGTGASPNTYKVLITVAGDVTATVTDMAGGVSFRPGTAQISTLTIDGTFEVGDRFTVTINGTPYGASGKPARKGEIAFVYKRKVYSPYGSVSNFSALNSATLWDGDVDVGAGFQNVSSEDEGSSAIVGLGDFQGNLVYFKRLSAQVWSVNADPSLNAELGNVYNAGTFAAKSIRQFGNVNLFFLGDAGIRSLRAQTGVVNATVVSDVGSPVDTIVIAQMAGLTDQQKAAACAVNEPVDQRYLLALDNQMYVFSFFENAKISAWSVYEPGVVFTDLFAIGNKLYGRAGDTIYLYGGDDGATYDSSTVTVTTPFLTAGKPGHKKTLKGFDAAVVGEWDVYLLYDPNNLNRKLHLGTVDKITYPEGGITAVDEATHIATQFVCTSAGPAKISNFAINFDDPLAPDPATS